MPLGAAKQLDLLPVDILKRYEKWKDVVRISGPRGLRAIRGFNDEPLHGEWKDIGRPGSINNSASYIELIATESLLRLLM